MRSAAAEAIGSIGNQQAIPELLSALKDKDEGVRSAVVHALGLIGSPQAIPELLNTLKDENAGVRSDAAQALGLIGNQQAIPDLLNTLKDKDEYVRSTAANALGLIGSPQTIPNLLSAFKDENESEQRNAAKVLEIMGSLAIPSLRNALKGENESVRTFAAEALGLIGNPQAISDLLNALKDENEVVRSSAVKALGLIGNPQVIPNLRNALNDENEDVHSAAVKALEQIGDSQIIPDLCNALNDENTIDRLLAAQALGLIGDPRAIPKLLNALRDDEDKYEYVHPSIVRALDLIGYPSEIQIDIAPPRENKALMYKWADFFIVFPDGGGRGWLSTILGSTNDRKALLTALNLPVSPKRNQQLLMLAKKTDANHSIRQKAIETLAESKDANIIEPLQSLKNDAQLNKTITELEEKVLPPLELLHDDTRKLSIKLAALQRLSREDPNAAKQEILRIIQQPEEDAFSNLAYRLLGDLQITDNDVIPLLQQRLDALDKQLRDWRKLRDSKPLSGLTTDEQDKVLEELRQAKQGIKNQHFAFDYAYALARLDPNIGMKLLTHNLADVRQGAYTGFAMKANIAWLKKLDQAREARRDDPVFYHTAYRAIDMGLSRLETLGNNPNEDEKDKELKELQKWQKELESAAPRTTAEDPDDEVLQRLQWTTLMMEHYNKLDKEFREKYGKKRVWPEDTLPVNEPYPAKP